MRKNNITLFTGTGFCHMTKHSIKNLCINLITTPASAIIYRVSSILKYFTFVCSAQKSRSAEIFQAYLSSLSHQADSVEKLRILNFFATLTAMNVQVFLDQVRRIAWIWQYRSLCAPYELKLLCVPISRTFYNLERTVRKSRISVTWA